MLKLFFKSKRHHSLVEDALLKLFGFLYNGRDQREADLLFFNNAIKISSQFDYFEVSLGEVHLQLYRLELTMERLLLSLDHLNQIS